MKIDLKGFSPEVYRRLGGNLDAVLETIQAAYGMGICLELVTLLIPDFNEPDEELSKIAVFIARISKDIPWRVAAFHPDCKMADRKRTPVEILLRAYQHGKNAGLSFVYAGNLPGKVQNTENTYCPDCQNLILGRWIKSS